MDSISGTALGLLKQFFSSLSENMPTPIHSILINGLSRCIAFSSAVYDLATVLLSLRWDTQTLLPPLITLLAAYLALLSFYRTTKWMLRTSVFLVKWGAVIGALVVGANWLNSAHEDATESASSSIVSNFGTVLYDWISGEQKITDGARSRSSRTWGSSKRKPKPWNSFEHHREWKRQDSRSRDSGDAQRIITDIVNGLGKAVKEGSWWKFMNDITEGSSKYDSAATRDKNRQPSLRDSKLKAGKSRSR